MSKEPIKFDRIQGGASLHESVRTDSRCTTSDHRGPWRVVECGGNAGEDRDIIECAECGEQRNVACNFDEDFS